MNFVDMILNRNKKSFKTATKKNKIEPSKEENIKKVLENSDDPTVKMYLAIQKYKDTKKELIEKGAFTEIEIPTTEMLGIINDFFQTTIDLLPDGVVIPIKTPYKINDKEQSVLIGKELMCVGQFVSKNGTKPKHGLKKQDKMAVLIDTDKIENHKDFINNVRINMKSEEDIFTNLISDSFLEEKWSKCRFSTIQISFADWETSNNHIKQLEDNLLATEILKSLSTLESEMITGITDFLNKKNQYLSDAQIHANGRNSNKAKNLDLNKIDEDTELNKIDEDSTDL